MFNDIQNEIDKNIKNIAQSNLLKRLNSQGINRAAISNEKFDELLDMEIEISTNNKSKKKYELSASINKHYSEKSYVIKWLEIEMWIPEYEDEELNDHNQEILKYLTRLSQSFISDFERKIVGRLYEAIEREETLTEAPDVTFNWRI